MTRIIILAGLLLSGFSGDPASASDGANSRDSNGTTVNDLGRALKSAAQNVEREIPKIGSAIGQAVKKITEKAADKQAPQEPSKQTK